MSEVQSTATQGGHVPFATHTGERIYMAPFVKASGLPCRLKHWQPTVDAMLSGVETDGLIYLMVDQTEVAPGRASRRPGPHVDMAWMVSGHGHGRPTHKSFPIPHQRWGMSRQGIILASDIEGCLVYQGAFDADVIGDGGNASEIPTREMDVEVLKPNTAYAGDTMTLLHESLPLLLGGKRTVVRLNVEGWVPHV